jgi:tetratricopeptide (TPR) repeat protein
MRKIFVFLFMFSFLMCVAYADYAAILERADVLDDEENHEGVKTFLLDSLKTVSIGREKAELYWRLARAYLNIGDQREDKGAEKEELLDLFAQGEEYADKSIDADADNHLGYYWKSSNIGRAGQVRGVLNSLFSAKPMKKLLNQAINLNPEHADSYYVLGQLYEQLPGFPLSFGNKDYAVSLGRKSLLLLEKELKTGIEDKMKYDYWTEMTKHLYARNWDSTKKLNEQKKKKAKYSSETDILKKSFYYEAQVVLSEVSDYDEAVELLGKAIRGLESIKQRKESEERDYKEAKELLKEWGL